MHIVKRKGHRERERERERKSLVTVREEGGNVCLIKCRMNSFFY